MRYVNSYVLKWPDATQVVSEFLCWAERVKRKDSSIKRIECFGSYTEDKWGIGSDLDIKVIKDTETLFCKTYRIQYHISTCAC